MHSGFQALREHCPMDILSTKYIDKLPENQKTAFTLHKVEGLSYQEIAEVMETTVSSVESLMHRAKENLKKILEDFYRNKGG